MPRLTPAIDPLDTTTTGVVASITAREFDLKLAHLALLLLLMLAISQAGAVDPPGSKPSVAGAPSTQAAGPQQACAPASAAQPGAAVVCLEAITKTPTPIATSQQPAPAYPNTEAMEKRLQKEQETKTKTVETALYAAGVLALVSVAIALGAMGIGTESGGFRVITHWGGFGGGTGGWQISPALAGLVVAAAVALGAVLLVVSALQVLSPQVQVAPEKKQEAK